MKNIIGWLSKEAGEAMTAQLRAVRPQLCVEIGVYSGQSLILIAEQLRRNGSGIVYGIDPWTSAAAREGFPDGSYDDWAEKVSLVPAHAECMRDITDSMLWPHVRIVTAKSQDVPHLFTASSIQWMHLDGNHAEEMARDDLELYVRAKLAPGAYVWVDDIGHAPWFLNWVKEFDGLDHVQDVDKYRCFRRQ